MSSPALRRRSPRILSVGWAGSAINALGTGYELLAISAAVIGGANLMGGEASAYGAFIGAALIFVIRNSLLMAGVDSNWQGTFVGLFLDWSGLPREASGRNASDPVVAAASNGLQEPCQWEERQC